MKTIQRYLSFFGYVSLRKILALLLIGYFGMVIVFAGVYHWFELVKPNGTEIPAPQLAEHLYFSFVTQSTVGFGDYRPDGAGKLIVVIQTTLALLIFTVGTAAIVARLTTPQKDGVLWDKILVFNPSEKRFQTRFVNRLPIDLSMARLTFRLRYQRITAEGEHKWSRKTIKALRSTISEIPTMYPMMASTEPVKEFTNILNVSPGEELVLEPAHLSEEISVSAIMLANWSSGSAVFSKSWSRDRIVCGYFNTTYENAEETGIDWTKWGTYRPVTTDECELCGAFGRCPFGEQKMPNKPNAADEKSRAAD